MSHKKSKLKKAVTPAISGRKLWLFRFAALLGVPLLLLVLLEMSLRVFGFGYPAAFLLPSQNHGQKTFVQNNQFGWRFFWSAHGAIAASDFHH